MPTRCSASTAASRSSRSAKLGGAVGAAGAAGADGTDGTIVTANPSGTDGSDISRIAIAGTNWNIAGSGGGASLGSEIPVSLVPDLTSAPGSGTTASRHDHVHGIAAAAPSGSGLGTANSEGSATAFARADHGHAGLGSTNPVTITPDQSGAVGSAQTAARTNHAHAIFSSAATSISNTSAEGSSATFARSDHDHAIDDGVIHGGALVDGTIPTAKYGDGTVTAGKMDSGSAADGNVATADGSGGVAWEAAAGGAGVSLSDSVAGTISPGQNSVAGTGATASRFDHAHGIGVGTPVDVGDANAVGSAGSFSRSDHRHRVPIDNTLQFDSSDDLGVSTERVVMEVSEWVQHFATGSAFDTSGHSGKYHEYTSPNTHRRIGSVQYDFDPENDSDNKVYRVYVIEKTGTHIDEVLGVSQTYSGNASQHRFHFTDGVMINPAVRIGIGLHRTDGGGNNYGLRVRAGDESQDSPRESYDDASNDFHFEGRFVHDRNSPTAGDTVGGTTANRVYGNPEIFYQIIHTHESLVGDGTVSANHISSGSASDGQVLTADGSAGAAWEDPAGGVSLSSSTPDALQVGQSGAVGSGSTAARSNHSHAILGGGPPQDVDTEDNATAGTATNFARGDHVHALAEDFVTPDMLKADSESEQGLMRTRIDAQEDLTLVTQAAAQAGTETTERVWSAQRVAQAIAAQAGDFDIHDDVTTREANIGSSDRFIFSDEDVSGDPMRYAQFVDIRNRFFDLGNTDSTPNDADLLLMCDSSTTGCPQERITAANLRTYMTDGFGALSDATPDSIQPDQAGSAGTGTAASRSDHSHAIASSTPVPIGTSNQEGSFTSFARTNHVHAGITTATPAASVAGGAAVLGTSTNRAARADHRHAAASALPIDVGSSLSAGSATTFARSDHRHALGTAIILTGNYHDDTVSNAKIRHDAIDTDQIIDGTIEVVDLDTDNAYSNTRGFIRWVTTSGEIGGLWESGPAHLGAAMSAAAENATPADNDRIPVVDVSEDPDVVDYVEVSGLSATVRDDIVEADIPSTIARTSAVPAASAFPTTLGSHTEADGDKNPSFCFDTDIDIPSTTTNGSWIFVHLDYDWGVNPNRHYSLTFPKTEIDAIGAVDDETEATDPGRISIDAYEEEFIGICKVTGGTFGISSTTETTGEPENWTVTFLQMW